MSKRDIILSLTGLIVFVRLYEGLIPLIKMMFCDHVYQTWDMKINSEESDKLKRLNGKIFHNHFRKCVKCEKVAESLSMIPGEFKWKKTYIDLPKNKTVIEVEVMGFGEETKAMKRDRIINSILK